MQSIGEREDAGRPSPIPFREALRVWTLVALQSFGRTGRPDRGHAPHPGRGEAMGEREPIPPHPQLLHAAARPRALPQYHRRAAERRGFQRIVAHQEHSEAAARAAAAAQNAGEPPKERGKRFPNPRSASMRRGTVPLIISSLEDEGNGSPGLSSCGLNPLGGEGLPILPVEQGPGGPGAEGGSRG
jgi:hypothetical protein